MGADREGDLDRGWWPSATTKEQRTTDYADYTDEILSKEARSENDEEHIRE